MRGRPPTHLQLARGGRDRAADREYEGRRRRDPALAAAARIRSSQSWRLLSAGKLRENPICERCAAATPPRTTPATEVHHVVPLVVDPSLAYDWSNLRSVCAPCHAALEREEGGARHG